MGRLGNPHPVDVERVLELVRVGTPLICAAQEVGWSIAMLNRLKSDEAFMELLGYAEAAATGAVEVALHKAAVAGNVRAIEIYLYNRDPNRWKDQRRVDINVGGQVNVASIAAHREALGELLMSGRVDMDRLQPQAQLPSRPVDADAEIVEAEIMEDAGGPGD